MVFCNAQFANQCKEGKYVTILILVDGFLQYRQEKINKEDKISHNPYFSRWFSAIYITIHKEM